MNTQHTIVVVDWRDAYSFDDWCAADQMDNEPVVCCSVGFLLSNHREGYVVIAQSDDGQGEMAAYLFIPVGMVERLRVVSEMRVSNGVAG